MAPPPVFDTANDVSPAPAPTTRLSGVTDSTGVVRGAWVTVTDFGLPSAPAAVTVMVPTRCVAVALASKCTLMIPELPPSPPLVMCRKSPPAVTTAV